jgi:hypothetical protein
LYPRTRHQFFAAAIAATFVFCIVGTSSRSYANTSVRGGVLVRDDVPLNNRTELLSRLEKITGWRHLRFENSGLLVGFAQQPVGGSQSARYLLTKAMTGDAVIILQDASSRSDVAFCRVVPGRMTHHSGLQPRAFVMLIDFDDFRQVTGDSQARAAFDVGWGFLHELHHVVNDSEDPQNATEPGECEGEINKMRLELDLPLRATYFYSPFPIKTNPDFTSRFVRLAFERQDSTTKRIQRYWLVWDATTVGGISQKLTALAR